MKKYHLSYDGNNRGLFSSEKEAEKAALVDYGNFTDKEFEENYSFWKNEQVEHGINFLGDLWVITELEITDTIIKVNGIDIDEFIESISDKAGSKEFILTKKRMIDFYSN
ncbi:hypothetical protein ACFGZ5_11800 [Pasteurella multocida]|uniref:hypothetical protein n=1 Tax=Pasteurella multocida TaxID=747 RepID=UPI002FDF768E